MKSHDKNPQYVIREIFFLVFFPLFFVWVFLFVFFAFWFVFFLINFIFQQVLMELSSFFKKKSILLISPSPCIWRNEETIVSLVLMLRRSYLFLKKLILALLSCSNKWFSAIKSFPEMKEWTATNMNRKWYWLGFKEIL